MQFAIPFMQIIFCCKFTFAAIHSEVYLKLIKKKVRNVCLFFCVATAVIPCRQLLLKMLIFMQNILLAASLFQPVPKTTGFHSIVPQRWASLFVCPSKLSMLAAERA